MGYKSQSPVSPFRRIMLARGYNMQEVAVLSGCSCPTLRKLDRMDRKSIGGINLRSVLKVSLFLEVAPVDLIPFLGITAKKAAKKGVNVAAHATGGGGRPKRSAVQSPPQPTEQH